jgi:hypothetical protein
VRLSANVNRFVMASVRGRGEIVDTSKICDEFRDIPGFIFFS